MFNNVYITSPGSLKLAKWWTKSVEHYVLNFKTFHRSSWLRVFCAKRSRALSKWSGAKKMGSSGDSPTKIHHSETRKKLPVISSYIIYDHIKHEQRHGETKNIMGEEWSGDQTIPENQVHHSASQYRTYPLIPDLPIWLLFQTSPS